MSLEKVEGLLQKFPDVIEKKPTLKNALEYGRLIKEWREKLEVAVAETKKQLQEIVEDMQHIPSKRLPLGKRAWLQEWNEVIEKLRKLGESEK